MARHRHRYSHEEREHRRAMVGAKKPMSTEEKVILGGFAALAVGIVGYVLLNPSTASAATNSSSSSGGSSSGGGSGGSSSGGGGGGSSSSSSGGLFSSTLGPGGTSSASSTPNGVLGNPSYATDDGADQ